MNTKTTISITEARKRIFDIADEVQGGTYYTFTEKGRPKVVIMSAEEFDSWQETLEAIRDFPNLKKNIREAESDYKKGNYVTLEEILHDEGYVLRDKSVKNKHDLAGRSPKKSTKKFQKNR